MKEAGMINDREMVNHLGGLYVAGVETTAIALHYLLYELAAHPEEQENLKKEIDDVLEKSGGEITYEIIKEMKYLDAVVKGSRFQECRFEFNSS